MSSLKNLPEKSHSEPHRGKHKGEDILPSSAKNDSACAAHGHTDHRQQMNDGPGGVTGRIQKERTHLPTCRRCLWGSPEVYGKDLTNDGGSHVTSWEQNQ